MSVRVRSPIRDHLPVVAQFLSPAMIAFVDVLGRLDSRLPEDRRVGTLIVGRMTSRVLQDVGPLSCLGCVMSLLD